MSRPRQCLVQRRAERVERDACLAGRIPPGQALALRHNGTGLDSDRGGPLRLVGPTRWLWKGARWVRAFGFLGGDALDLRHANGCHTHADPWAEERSARQGTHAMQQRPGEAQADHPSARARRLRVGGSRAVL